MQDKPTDIGRKWNEENCDPIADIKEAFEKTENTGYVSVTWKSVFGWKRFFMADWWKQKLSKGHP